jgi:hypothetical protein
MGCGLISGFFLPAVPNSMMERAKTALKLLVRIASAWMVMILRSAEWWSKAIASESHSGFREGYNSGAILGQLA